MRRRGDGKRLSDISRCIGKCLDRHDGDCQGTRVLLPRKSQWKILAVSNTHYLVSVGVRWLKSKDVKESMT